MSNFKHAAMACASVLLIGSLAVGQLGDFVYRPVDEKLLSHGVSDSIIVEELDDEIAADEALDLSDIAAEEEEGNVEEPSSDITEGMSEEELNALIEMKSKPQVRYVVLSSGTLSIMGEPCDEANVIDAVECATEVKVLSTSDGWSFVEYAGGRQGYVPVDVLTDSKAEAQYAQKRYDNYVLGVIKTANEDSVVRIRKGPSTNSEIITTLKNGDKVLMMWNEDDFVKILWGGAYSEGYMVASALQLTEEWTSKTEVAQVQAEAKKKAEEEAKKKAEEEAKQKAAEEARKKAEKEAKANAKKSSKTSSSVSAVSKNAPASSKGQAIVNEAKKYLGVKYVYGGSTPKGFDCSGLVKYVCAKNGISLSRTSASQARQGVTVSRNNLQPGDLLFFAKGGRVHHVGIYVGNGQMIHAPHTGSYVKYDSINTAYRQREFYCAKRVY